MKIKRIKNAGRGRTGHVTGLTNHNQGSKGVAKRAKNAKTFSDRTTIRHAE